MKYLQRQSYMMQIADEFGLKNQQAKCIEELSELIREIAKNISRNEDITDSTIEEMADVEILIEQLIYLAEKNENGISNKLENAIEYKLERTIQRIEEGYYK